ncbi:hypothetical protein QR721_05945 [Aciduricibacillus chroicocephali]|uniref:Flagellar hook-length control protein-like C-terminal domain-containing protein n=1 Tax=Aciduricibacillus chroicocephali TaxID=3054939 RepID=A0ABY9KYN8_9BACI|nr:hypothetical protein QR721_05945 [Bacillaceae bacterium 44XB]
MSHNRITGQPVQGTTTLQTKEVSLRTGQIVDGKVAKLYPNQKALIQIGGKQMVAQLETGLSVGERYHFQVSVEEGTVFLKVIGEQSSRDTEQNIANLLTKLGLQSGKAELALTKNLLNSHIPVEKEQLRQAFALLKEAPDKIAAAELIKTMVGSRIPLTKDIFLALFMKETKGLNEVVRQALSQFVKAAESQSQIKPGNLLEDSKQLKGGTLWERLQNKFAETVSNSKTGLNIPQARNATLTDGTLITSQSKALTSAIEMLERMSSRPHFMTSLTVKQLTPLLTENTALFNAVKEAGLINGETTFSTWKSEWTSFIQRNASTFKEATPLSLEMLSGKENVLNVNGQTASTLFKSLQTGISSITNEVQTKEPQLQALQQSPLEKVQQTPIGSEQRTINSDGSPTRFPLPFNLSEKEIALALDKWIGVKSAQQTAASSLLSEYGQELRNAASTNQSLPQNVVGKLAQDVEQKLLPLLPAKAAAAIKEQLDRNPQMVEKLIATLEKFTALKTDLTQLEKIHTKLQSGTLFTQPQPKEQFLGAIRLMIDETGLTHEENIFRGETSKVSQDLKSQLLLLDKAPGQPSQVQEAGRQMLQFINGLQLQSVSQSEHLIQASMMLPGGALGLESDARLDFEGKKDKNGAINPEFCRILFYLDLQNLEETIVDMNVNKGNVSVTVYNDHDLISSVARRFVPLLEKGLEEMDYKLASISIKSRSAREQVDRSSNSAASVVQRGNKSGKVDYRI